MDRRRGCCDGILRWELGRFLSVGGGWEKFGIRDRRRDNFDGTRDLREKYKRRRYILYTPH